MNRFQIKRHQYSRGGSDGFFRYIGSSVCLTGFKFVLLIFLVKLISSAEAKEELGEVLKSYDFIVLYEKFDEKNNRFLTKTTFKNNLGEEDVKIIEILLDTNVTDVGIVGYMVFSSIKKQKLAYHPVRNDMGKQKGEKVISWDGKWIKLKTVIEIVKRMNNPTKVPRKPRAKK